MPIYMEISRLHRAVTIVARGKVTADDIQGAARELFDARVPEFTKIIDIFSASSDLSESQVQQIADLFRADPKEKRGPVAFIINPARVGFGHAFAKVTQGERPIRLFESLHQARDWLEDAKTQTAERAASTPHPASSDGPSPWNDPDRQGILIRGHRRREIPKESLQRAASS